MKKIPRLAFVSMHAGNNNAIGRYLDQILNQTVDDVSVFCGYGELGTYNKNVHFVKSSNYGRNILSKLLASVSFAFFLPYKQILSHQKVIVFLPTAFAVMTMMVVKKLGTKRPAVTIVVMDDDIIYALEKIGINALRRLTLTILKLFYSQADNIIVISKNMQDYYHGMGLRQVDMLPLWSHLAIDTAFKFKERVKDVALSKFIYFGTLGDKHDIDALITFIDWIEGQAEHSIIIATDSDFPGKSELSSYETVELMPFLSSQELLLKLQQGCVPIICNHSRYAGCLFPSKIFDFDYLRVFFIQVASTDNFFEFGDDTSHYNIDVSDDISRQMVEAEKTLTASKQNQQHTKINRHQQRLVAFLKNLQST